MAKAPDPLPPEVLAALERRQPIEAIKLLLKRRAHAADATPPGAGRRSPGATAAPASAPPPATTDPTAFREGLSPGEVPDSESTLWAWVLVALVAYLAYRLLGD